MALPHAAGQAAYGAERDTASAASPGAGSGLNRTHPGIPLQRPVSELPAAQRLAATTHAIMPPAAPGGVLGGVDWSRWSVVLLKPDCVRRGLADDVLTRLGKITPITWQERVTVADWQLF